MEKFEQLTPTEKKEAFEKVLTETIRLQGLHKYDHFDSTRLDKIAIQTVFGECSPEIFAEYVEFCHDTGMETQSIEEVEEDEDLAEPQRKDHRGNNTKFATRLRVGSEILALV